MARQFTAFRNAVNENLESGLTFSEMSGLLRRMVFSSPAEIRARTKAAGISISELCRRVGIPRSTFDTWRPPEDEVEFYGRLIRELERAEAESTK